MKTIPAFVLGALAGGVIGGVVGYSIGSSAGVLPWFPPAPKPVSIEKSGGSVVTFHVEVEQAGGNAVDHVVNSIVVYRASYPALHRPLASADRIALNGAQAGEIIPITFTDESLFTYVGLGPCDVWITLAYTSDETDVGFTVGYGNVDVEVAKK